MPKKKNGVGKSGVQSDPGKNVEVQTPVVEQPGVHRGLVGAAQLDFVDTLLRRQPLDCPPGLEHLCFVDNLSVKQKVQAIEIVTGIEKGNKYEIFNGMGQRMFVSTEGESPVSIGKK